MLQNICCLRLYTGIKEVIIDGSLHKDNVVLFDPLNVVSKVADLVIR